MQFVIDTESLKKVAGIEIEFKWAQKLAIEIFNNVGNNSEQYKKLCKGLEHACDKIIADLESLKLVLPSDS